MKTIITGDTGKFQCEDLFSSAVGTHGITQTVNISPDKWWDMLLARFVDAKTF